MKYCAMATDYDGTLITDEWVDSKTIDALQRYPRGQLLLGTEHEFDERILFFLR